MNSAPGHASKGSFTVGKAMLLGTLTVGSLDLFDAIVFFGLRGVAPIRILQSIASGLLGRPAYAGGAGTALLGLLLHFFIAFTIVATYLIPLRRVLPRCLALIPDILQPAWRSES